MVKQIILILGFSVVVILFKDQLSQALDGIVFAHNYIVQNLHVIFSDDMVGSIIQDVIALLAIPLACGLIAALIFWAMKRAETPHFMPAIWIAWLVLIVTMVAQNGMVTHQMVNKAHAVKQSQARPQIAQSSVQSSLQGLDASSDDDLLNT